MRRFLIKLLTTFFGMGYESCVFNTAMQDLEHIKLPDNKKIFLPFFSTKRRDSKDGILTGAGLGLAITRKVLEPYNVSFEIHSNVGEGTLMVLHIPLKNTRTIKAEVEHNARVQI